MPLQTFTILILLFLSACNLSAPAETTPKVTTAADETLVVAWVEAGNLMVWREGDEIPRRVASGGVVQPFIAPDGEHVAFTRGPAGLPETLWILDINGTAEQQLVGPGRPRTYEAESQIGEVAWYDDTVLYFNTLRGDGFGSSPKNDLYRANIRTREVALILPQTEGGRFAISPDKQYIAIAYPGTYGRQDGRISLIDPLALERPTNLLFFVGVASGSEAPFYPELHWMADSNALLVAIPDADLVYSDTAETIPPTRLWHLPIDNPSDRALMGSVEASFFGLPRWSNDGASLLYLRRTPGSNTFTVYVADGAGANPDDFVTGEAGQLELPRWIPGSNRFVYAHGNMGEVWLGGYNLAPERLSEEVIFQPHFVSSDAYVFATPAAIAADGMQLRFGRIGKSSQFIASVGATIPIFDAVLVKK